MKKIIVDPGLIDSLELGDSVMDWDREKSSVTDEHGNTVGYIRRERRPRDSRLALRGRR